ncbi:MAG: hypothetical protein ACO3UM_18640 [Planctomycetota bacterium]
MIRRLIAASLGLCLLHAGGCTYGAARARDFADCFRVSVGGGLGLTASVQATDWFSPGIGAASRTWNFGYLDRDTHGSWVESCVIQTPRLAYQGLALRLEEQSREQMDEDGVLTRLALDSLNLPHERWVRTGGRVRVEQFALFNPLRASDDFDSSWLGGFLVEPGDVVLAPVKDVWQSSFLEVGGTVALIHARVGFSPLQLADFVAGLFGFDPAGDDARKEFYAFDPVHPFAGAGRLDGP